MKTVDAPPTIPAEDLADLEDAIADLIKGVRDPRKMEQAARELEEGREEIRHRLGILDMSTDLTDPEDE